jgi:DNA-binding NarL/FixJ family response regulator
VHDSHIGICAPRAKARKITHRILVVESESLFGDAVASLLREAHDLQVRDVAYTDDTAFLRDVSDLRPDAILLNEKGPLDSRRILELLANIPTLASLRVIVVRPDDNMIDVYERQRVTAHQGADLLALVRREGA